jgi:hypothetical protein
MSNYSKTVLWLGLFMIVAGVAANWSLVSGTIFGSKGTTAARKPNNKNVFAEPGVPGINAGKGR